MRWTKPGAALLRRQRGKLDRFGFWHSWFAWLPVPLKYTDEMVWLERVERRCYETGLTIYWEYRRGE